MSGQDSTCEDNQKTPIIEWAIAYYHVTIEDIQRKKKSLMDITYYSGLVYGVIFLIMNSFEGSKIASGEFYKSIAFVTVIYSVLSLYTIHDEQKLLHEFRHRIKVLNRDFFPTPITQIAKDEKATDPRYPNFCHRDWPIKLFYYVVPFAGAGFVLLYVWLKISKLG